MLTGIPVFELRRSINIYPHRRRMQRPVGLARSLAAEGSDLPCGNRGDSDPGSPPALSVILNRPPLQSPPRGGIVPELKGPAYGARHGIVPSLEQTATDGLGFTYYRAS